MSTHGILSLFLVVFRSDFVGADNLRFKRPCVPGDQVMLRASIVSDRRGIWKFDVSSDVDGELAASATILCADR